MQTRTGCSVSRVVSADESLDALIICLRGCPGPALPPTGSLIVRLSRISGSLEPRHLSLLVQIRPSYQLHPKGQASLVCGLSVPLQPLVRVLAEHTGGCRSGRWGPAGHPSGAHHTPSGKPGKCSTPRARRPWGCSNAWPG